MTTKSNGKQQQQAPVTLAWHAHHDAAIAAAKGAYGTVPSPDAYRLALNLGAGKRPGVEALYIAMTLRPDGCNPDNFVAVKQKQGYANNCLQHLNDEGNRAVQKVIHVTRSGKVRYARLTAKGEAQMKALGMSATALRPFMAPVKLAAQAKATPQPKPKAASPAKAPASPKGKAKPKGQPIQAPAPQAAPAAPQAPRTVLTNEGPKVIQPQPQPQPATADGK